MKGKIPGLENALHAAIGKRVISLGFRRKAQGFRKSFPLGKLALQLGFIRHKSDFDVTAEVAVRFDQLEDLLNRDNNSISNRMKSDTFTVGSELGNILEGRPHRWTISDDSDVEPAAESIVELFQTVGCPYLERFSELENALEVLSGDDKEAWLHMPVHNLRAKRALGLAYLLGDRERFFSVAAAKTEFLTARNDFGLDSFVKFRDALIRRGFAPPVATS